ncbi:gluzincin family metallopeptidase [Tunturibacter empetritectus]|uniref:Peptidase MA-like domain-containing protein n=1 Tax=Tunturiibacter lichenicola TaxID=2051959 RepID=A0A7W8N5B4_9BACT|nr:hypothetical protein [Edaphobacter lichenicola]MBB5345348.1 hypothetical protein [Edaphobacter lichenicola]
MRCLWGRTTVLMFACLTLLWPCCVGCAQGRHWRGEQIVASQSFVEGGGTIQVDFAAGGLDLSHSDVISWVQASAHSVAVYYGRFPVARARVVIEPIAGDSDSIHGTTWGGMGGFPAVTRIRLAQHATKDDLKDDWVMTHELVHTALPDLPDDQHWMEEGLATYIEPIARAGTGRLTEERVWAEFLHEMHNGEPERGDRGLNETQTWGRTYWGGAMFCLMADVSIRRETNDRKGLKDALRAVVESGGGIDKDWPLSRVLQIGDRATGTTVLTNMYAKWSEKPVPVDLSALWKELGVSAGPNNGVVFDAKAPLAAVRQSIIASR